MDVGNNLVFGTLWHVIEPVIGEPKDRSQKYYKIDNNVDRTKLSEENKRNIL